MCFSPLFSQESPDQQTKFFVVIPSYNNSKWCEANLESVFFQTYQNWTIYYIDDCSTDGTGDIVERYVDFRGMNDKCHIVHNAVRVGAMENLYHAIHTADPHSVIVDFDGDDRLAHNGVFQELADVYADPEVWLTYGSYQFEPRGVRGFCRALPDNILSNIRGYGPWVTSQLRTFYAQLFLLIQKEHLMKEGRFFEIASDVGLFMPMIEMASPRHIKYIHTINYLYNFTNPLSDSRKRLLQLETDLYIRSLPRYKPLAQLFSEQENPSAHVAVG